jgi:ABC-type sugar transport system substrate-binding protein
MLHRIGLGKYGRIVAGLFAVGALALALAACGSSSSSSSTTSSSSGGSSSSASSSSGSSGHPAILAQDFTKWSTPPATIPVTAPHAKPIPKNVSIAYITCGVPTCTYIADAVSQAAKVLGWKYTTIAAQPTPSSIKQGWEAAVRLHPTAVLASGFDRVIFNAQLLQLKSMGVGVFECCAGDPPGNGLTMSISGPADQAYQGDREAAMDSTLVKGNPNVLYVNLPEFATMKPELERYLKMMKVYSPSSHVAVINESTTEEGTPAGADQIVSYLRAHPSVNFVQLAQDAMSSGLPAAMKEAGLNVPFGGAGGGPQPLQMIASGVQAGTIQYPYYEIFWTLVDGIARWVNHESTAPDDISTPFYIITKQNVNSTPGTIVPNLEQKYAKLWGR